MSNLRRLRRGATALLRFATSGLFILLAASSCKESKPAPPTQTGWPSLPTTDEQARELLATTTKKTTAAPPSGDENIADLLATALDRGELRAGEAAIEAFIDGEASRAGKTKRFYLLWGTHHDSAAQIELFRRVTGLTAKTHFTHVVLEQLRANGYWSDIPATEQRGDDDALARFRREGARSALDEIRLAQERDDYAAWKYGYVGSILDIVAEARADHEVLGCDMPLELQARLPRSVRDTSGNALRELHCSLSLKSRITTADARVAMLWGAQHVVGEGGMRRLLPPNSHVASLRVIGRRTEDDPIARAVYDRFELVDPVLLPTQGIVILPEKSPSPHFERKRYHDDGGLKPGDVNVSSPRARVDRKNHLLAVALNKDRTLIAPLVLPTEHSSCEIRVDDDAPEVTLTLHD